MSRALENGNAVQPLPLTGEARQLVLEELRTIESNHHFRGSKRYPALLNYVVNAALDGRSADLKERTLGVEVFGRDPDYDTNADPVVRVSAGEVRKRIAQYYHENRHNSRVQIELPIGSYAPEFWIREQEAPATQAAAPQQKELRLPPLVRRSRRAAIWSILLATAALLVLGAVSLRYFRSGRSAAAQSAVDQFWYPMMQSNRPVLIVLRTVPPGKMLQQKFPTVGDHVRYVSVSIAISLANLARLLDEHSKNYEVKEAPETTLTDISARPSILVGADGNEWTMRLVGPLRFHFAFSDDGMERIVDSSNPGRTGWEFNQLAPYTSVTADYAIVARFHDATTQGPVMILAGLGSYGTEAASEFVQSPQYLAQLSKLPGWQDKNIELVLKTDVIGYHAGPPALVAATVW